MTILARYKKNENFHSIHVVPDTYIQKVKKSYVDSRARRTLGSINTELQDIQRIMVANIEEVLQRGEALSGKCSQCWQYSTCHPMGGADAVQNHVDFVVALLQVKKYNVLIHRDVYFIPIF